MATLEELAVKNLGILYSNEDYGISVSELLTEEFKKTGGTVKSEALEMKEANYREKVTKLKDMDAIYIVGYSHHFENVFKQLREENFAGTILGSNTASTPSI